MKNSLKMLMAFILLCNCFFCSASTIKGAGATSCAYFLQTYEKNKSEWRQWITGFISGRNFETDASKGKDIDEDGFVFEVKNFCSKEPMKNVYEAVIWMYDKKL